MILILYKDTIKHYNLLRLREKTSEGVCDAGSPPEAVLLGLVCPPAAGQEGVVQRLHHLLVQHVSGVQVVHAGHQLVEAVAQDQPAARRVRGVAGVAVGTDSPRGSEQPTDLIHSGSKGLLSILLSSQEATFVELLAAKPQKKKIHSFHR